MRIGPFFGAKQMNEFPRNFVSLFCSQKMVGSTTAEEIETWKSSHDFFWDKSYIPNCVTKPHGYTISGDKRTAIAKGKLSIAGSACLRALLSLILN